MHWFLRIKWRAVGGLLLFAVFFRQPMQADTAEQEASAEIREALATYGEQHGFPSLHLQAADPVRVPSLPAGVTAKAIAVAQVQFDLVQQAWRVQLRCRAPQRCLPFVAFVPASAALASHTTRFQSRGECCLPTASAPTSAVVRPGETVRLITEAPGMRLSQPALCLDRGAVGDQVRVRARSRRHWGSAVVLGPGTVRALRD